MSVNVIILSTQIYWYLLTMLTLSILFIQAGVCQPDPKCLPLSQGKLFDFSIVGDKGDEW